MIFGISQGFLRFPSLVRPLQNVSQVPLCILFQHLLSQYSEPFWCCPILVFSYLLQIFWETVNNLVNPHYSTTEDVFPSKTFSSIEHQQTTMSYSMGSVFSPSCSLAHNLERSLMSNFPSWHLLSGFSYQHFVVSFFTDCFFMVSTDTQDI